MSKIELFENERAKGYDRFVETWIPGYPYFMEGLPKLFRKTTPKDLLVVGCGTGNEIEGFVNASENWNITGIDPSPEMIKQANDRFQTNDKVTFIEGLVSDLDSKKKFGAATLLLVLHFMEDNGNKLNLLKDIAKRLVSGATFVMLDITGDRQQIKQNLEVLSLLLPNGLEEEEINHRMHRIANELFAVSEKRIAALCIEAGFEKPTRFFQSSIYMGWMMKRE